MKKITQCLNSRDTDLVTKNKMLNLYCTDPMLRCQASQMWMKSVTLKQLSIIAVLAALSHLTFWPQLAARVAYSCTAEENANKEPAARATLLVVVERPCCKYLAFAAKISPKCIIVAFCLRSQELKPAFACATLRFFLFCCWLSPHVRSFVEECHTFTYAAVFTINLNSLPAPRPWICGS